MIRVQELEIERKERELDATIRKPADAQRYRVQTEADAERYRIEAEANAKGNALKAVGTGEAEAQKARGLAEAEVRRAQGLAEAEVIRAKGEAEAEAMRKKAEAWRAYNEAAVAQMYIERLPDIARAVAEPMSRIERVVLISNGNGAMGASRVTRDVLDIVAQLPPLLEASTGMSLKDLLAALPKVGQKGAERK
jgi:flotillin